MIEGEVRWRQSVMVVERRVQWREKHNGGKSVMDGEAQWREKQDGGIAQWREKCNGGSECDKWRNPMEGGSAMEGEHSQREKCIEGGRTMEGEREGHQGRATGNRDR